MAGSGQTNPVNQRLLNGLRYARSARPQHDFAYSAALREESRLLREESRRLLETSRELHNRMASRFARASGSTAWPAGAGPSDQSTPRRPAD
jgi:hypothetical protein